MYIVNFLKVAHGSGMRRPSPRPPSPPFIHQPTYLFQLGFNVLFLHCRDTNVLNVILVRQQGGLHDVAQLEVVQMHIKCVACQLGNAIPVAILHGTVGHQLQQRAGLVEVINLLLEIVECLPLLQALW